MDKKIAYKSGYKYQIAADYHGILMPELEYKGHFEDDFLLVAGRDYVIKKGYASDGPSGPTVDTKNFMRGAFRHDGGYQLIRMGVFPESSRQLWDNQLRQDCLQDGMSGVRSALVYQGVHFFGSENARKGKDKPTLYAP